MRNPLPAVILAVVLGLSGCRLPRNSGPIPQSLLISRQYSQQGIGAMERAQWAQAEDALAKAVQTCPVNAEARHSYAEALWHRGARAEAIGQLEEASRLTPEDAALHARIAEMRLEVGQTDAARVRAEQALDLDSKLPIAWAIHARVLRAAGQPRLALADYHRALGYAPDERSILLETADLYRELNQPQRALATLQNLCDTYGPGEEPQQVLDLLGRAYWAVGRHDDAAESWSTALVRGQPTSELLCRLAEAQAALGRSSEALGAARQALALDPQYRPAMDLLARLEVARQSDVPLQR